MPRIVFGLMGIVLSVAACAQTGSVPLSAAEKCAQNGGLWRPATEVCEQAAGGGGY